MLERGVSQAVLDLGLVGRSVLVAASGGVDSTVLSHLLCGLAESFGLAVSLGHVNHTLRGAESDADQAAVAALAGRLQIPFVFERVDPQAARRGSSSRQRPTLEEAARRLRYEALDELRRKAEASMIATAHNADDQAETVLLRLMRGCGPDGLGGIPEMSIHHCGPVARPLLRATRSQIVAYAEQHRLSWREDASNRDTRYARNRLRRDWLPGLARDFNPQLLRTIGNLADAHRRDADWIASLVAAEASRIIRSEDDGLYIDSRDWRTLHEALAMRLVQHVLAQLGTARDVTRVHIGRVLAFLASEKGTKGGQGGRILELPGGIRVARQGDIFRLYRVNAEAHARLNRK